MDGLTIDVTRQIAQDWLSAFAAALRDGEPDAVAAQFLPHGHWRDVLAFTWRIGTVSGRDAVAAMLRENLARTKVTKLHLPTHRSPPRRVRRAGTECIETIFSFETASGRADAVARLAADSDGVWRCWTLVTTLEELRGFPEIAAQDVDDAERYSRDFGGENWLDQRKRDIAYEERDPVALVVGGGQAGLAVAARLNQLGIDTLIVDKHARIGDNWRLRYHALTLHNEVHVNHMPYMPFPPTWPVFIPKDKLANWFEAYVEALELNYWTSTELIGGRYDDNAGHWVIRLKRDGQERVVRPRHVVFATGASGIPIKPDTPGLDSFKGKVMHSGAYTEGGEWKGRPAIVIGTGNSGHDVAQDLCASGAIVTMVQRSPTYIVSLKEAQKVYAIYNEGIAFEDCDLIATATPYPVLCHAYQLSTAEMRNNDRDLLAGLQSRGFRLTYGEDDTGFQMMYLRRGGGYYFNVGCSDMIIDGRIKLAQYDDIDRFVADGLKLKDGTVLPAELVVTATGYRNQQDMVRAFLGDAVADRIGPVWGFDEGGELRNMWGRTQQPGLWFTAGSLAQCRIYSRYLAVQIKAIEEGLLSPR
jgi:putative flavoprotein involved in K+ transport